jgi:CubicO group peptidase (beta-lactamase class C family)
MQSLENELLNLVGVGTIPGLSLAILQGGSVTKIIAIGRRGPHDPEPVNAHTVFEAASLTKPLAAFIALQLVDEGRLDLDKPLVEICGEYITDDVRAAAISARHVLTHTSGLPNVVTEAAPLRTHFKPGERFSYGSSAFTWLQRAIEATGGDKLEKLAIQRVFGRFGMQRSSLEWHARFEDNHAVGHEMDGEPVQKRRAASAHASWSLVTTAGDYSRFLMAVLRGDGLTAATHAAWFSPAVQARQGFAEDLAGDNPVDPLVAWGLGWGLEPAQGCFFHWGHMPGSRAYLLCDRHRGDGAVWFANSARGLRLAHRIIPAAMGGSEHPSIRWMQIGQL